MKIYYCVVEEMEVPEDADEAVIGELVAKQADGKDHMWDYRPDLLFCMMPIG